MAHIQSRYDERKFKIGDLVLAESRHGNMETPGYSHIPKKHVGVITRVFHQATGSGGSYTSPNYPYEVGGHVAGWAEDELTLVTVPVLKIGLAMEKLHESQHKETQE
jgi:hypothetical protein